MLFRLNPSQPLLIRRIIGDVRSGTVCGGVFVCLTVYTMGHGRESELTGDPISDKYPLLNLLLVPPLKSTFGPPVVTMTSTFTNVLGHRRIRVRDWQRLAY